MPKVSAPLLSFSASGQIAKSQVYSTWKGIPYVRRYAVPANPKTTKQMNNRGIWSMISQSWLFAPAAIQAAFNAYAVGKPLTGRNKFVSENQKLLAVQPTPEDITGYVMSPGNGGALPATSLIVTPGADTLTLTATIPDAPAGWTLTKVWGAALPNQDPTDAFQGPWTVVSDDTAPYSVALTGLTVVGEYAVGLWIEWVKPDGSTAYSRALTGVGTPS